MTTHGDTLDRRIFSYMAVTIVKLMSICCQACFQNAASSHLAETVCSSSKATTLVSSNALVLLNPDSVLALDLLKVSKNIIVKELNHLQHQCDHKYSSDETHWKLRKENQFVWCIFLHQRRSRHAPKVDFQLQMAWQRQL